MALFLTALLLLASSPLPAPDDSVATEIEHRLKQAGAPERALQVRTHPLHTAATVDSFYRDRQFQPAWTTSAGLLSQARTLLAHLRRADRDGLTPSDYHSSILDSLVTETDVYGTSARQLPPALRADLDLALTDAFFLYGVHMLQGRIQADTFRPQWNAAPRRADLVALLNRTLLHGDVQRSLQALAPPQVAYARLRTAYDRYQTLAEDGGWPLVPDGPPLRPDSSDARVPLLRLRLQATGDLTEDPPAGDQEASPARPVSTASTSSNSSSHVYDSTLVAAVRGFQRRHGLSPDGVVGRSTLDALNVPADKRAQQLRLALERWRWLPETLGDRHVRVNIAGFSLQYFEDGRAVMSMPVVTGRPFRQTPVFSDHIRYLVFNPHWNVPRSLAVADKLPDIQRDPSYLSRQQMRVFNLRGQEVSPDTVRWTSLSESNFPYRLRQEPGPSNALGRVKFMFPNKYDVYLHDTPSRGDFLRDQRAFSSGCIRLSRPLELAATLLSDLPDWDARRIDAVLATGKPHTVWLRRPVPVHILYWTAWADSDGTIHFRPDIYDRDPALSAALQQDPPVLAQQWNSR